MVVPVWKSVGDQLIWKAESDVWITRTGTWQPESPLGSRMGYLPWLKSCWLLQLNHGAWGGGSHQPTFMGSCLTTSHRCLPCLPSRWISLVDGFFAWWMILLLWEDAAILWSGYGIQRQNYVALFQGSKMSAGFYSRNLILDVLG